jgi:hypothetical protein
MDAARAKEEMQHAGRAIQENLAEGVGRMQEKVEESVRRNVDRTRGMLASVNEQFGGFVQESPVVAIGGAFAVGWMIAKVARAFR